MYTKLANSILTSTVWMESNETRIVWLTLLAMCDKNGEVQASIPGLANVARVTVQECETSIQLFLSPDPYSRTKSDEGRRLEEIDGGWFVINHNKYRDLASDSDVKRKAAERQRRYRERQKRNGESVTESVTSVTRCDKSRQISHTDTDTDTKANTEETQSIVAKRDDLPPYNLIVSEYVAAFGGNCRVTDKRKTAIKARWRDQYWRDNWQAALELGSTRSFLLGDNDRGWKIDIDFFLQPDTVTKIMEGKYAGQQQRQLTSNEIRERANAEAFAALVFEDDD